MLTRSLYQVSVVLVLALLFQSCMLTRNSAFTEADEHFVQADYEGALELLSSKDAKNLYPPSDSVLRYLDWGVLEYYAKQSSTSTEHLSEAERLIEENFTKSVTEAAGSLLLNDTVMAYAGEDYEDLYLNVFNVLNYARLNSFDDAFVEIRRLNNKLLLLQDKYAELAENMNASDETGGKAQAGQSEFYKSALAHYLSMILYRADQQYDNAAIDLRGIHEAFTRQADIYNFPQPDFSEKAGPSSKARVSLLAFTGRSPYKKAVSYRINTGDSFVSVSREEEDSRGVMRLSNQSTLYVPGARAGYNFKCQVPSLVRVPSAIKSVRVLVDDTSIRSFDLLESVENIALDTFKIKEPLIYVKTIVRTVVKGIVAAEAKNAINDQAASAGVLGALGSLAAGLATDIAVEASEQADLRSARFYPGKVWVSDFELEPGEHTLIIEYLNASGQVLYQENLGQVEIKGKGLNLFSSSSLL